MRALVVGTEVARLVDTLLPTLPDSIALSVVIVDRDLSLVGGITGRAPEPGSVLVEISSTFSGVLAKAARAGLASTLNHEFHHLPRGWTIEGAEEAAVRLDEILALPPDASYDEWMNQCPPRSPAPTG